MTPATTAILAEVAEERRRQHAKWGVQRLPLGFAQPFDAEAERTAKATCERATRAGTLTWRDLIDEEVCELFAEPDREKARAEAIQAAAVLVQMVEAIDRENIPHAYHPTAWCDGCARHGCGATP